MERSQQFQKLPCQNCKKGGEMGTTIPLSQRCVTGPQLPLWVVGNCLGNKCSGLVHSLRSLIVVAPVRGLRGPCSSKPWSCGRASTGCCCVWILVKPEGELK